VPDPVGHSLDFAIGIGEGLKFGIGAIEHRHGAAKLRFDGPTTSFRNGEAGDERRAAE
jgi:hypothetical protein